MDYLSLIIFKEPLTILAQVIKHFIMVNIIAPSPDTFYLKKIPIPAVTFSTSWNYYVFGWIGLSGWLALFTGGIYYAFCRENTMRAFWGGLAVCLLFIIAFHSFYGIQENKYEFFLYTGHATFILIAFLGNYSIKNNIFIKTLLVAVTILVIINNLLVVKEIIRIYS